MKRLFVPALVCTAALVLAGASGANAADTKLDANEVVSVIENAAPAALSDSVGVTGSGASLTSATETTEVAFPADQNGAVSLSGKSGGELSVSLPSAEKADQANVSPSGVSYDNNDGSHSVVSLGADGALTALTVLENAQAPTSYDYSIASGENSKLEKQDDGSVNIVAEDGSISGVVDVPWAVDANGVSVPTGYEVNGTKLTQWVDTSSPDIAYPVVADPKIYNEWWGTVVKLTKAETKTVAANASYSAITAAACGYIPIVHVRVVCIALTGAKAISLGDTARAASKAGRCLAINVPAGFWAGPGGSYLGMNFTNVKC